MSIRERFNMKWAESSDGCWVWSAYRMSKGYGVMNAGRKNMQAHRLSYELHVGPIPKGLCVLHRCDNPPCVNPKHLFIGTQADNMADCASKGRTAHPDAIGEKNNAAKLRRAQVAKIKRRLLDGETVADIARCTGISKWTIYKIGNGGSWVHVMPEGA